MKPIRHDLSIGLWGLLNQGADPFGGPVRNYTIEQALDALAQSGIKLVSVHDGDLWADDATEETIAHIIERFMGMLEMRGMKVYNFTTNSFSNPIFRSGALSSPFPQVREAAIAKITLAMDYANVMGAENFIFWGGRDGTDGAYEAANGFKLYMEGLQQCILYSIQRGYKYGFTLEPKVYEPRLMGLHISTGAAATAGILGWLNEEPFKDRVGVNPEYPQHTAMLGLDPAMELTQLLEQDMLARFIHFGGQINGRMDCDLPPGFGGNVYADFMVALILQQHGWEGVIEFDCRPTRTTTTVEGLAEFAKWCEYYWRMLEHRVAIYIDDPKTIALEAIFAEQSLVQAQLDMAVLGGGDVVEKFNNLHENAAAGGPGSIEAAGVINTDTIEELWRHRVMGANGLLVGHLPE